jgi:hypothetical protein
VDSKRESLKSLRYFLELPMQHRLSAQQAQQQHRGMEFVTICLNNNNVAARGQLRPYPFEDQICPQQTHSTGLERVLSGSKLRMAAEF